MRKCVCVCVCERKIVRQGETLVKIKWEKVRGADCVCVRERGRGRDWMKGREIGEKRERLDESESEWMGEAEGEWVREWEDERKSKRLREREGERERERERANALAQTITKFYCIVLFLWFKMFIWMIFFTKIIIILNENNVIINQLIKTNR